MKMMLIGFLGAALAGQSLADDLRRDGFEGYPDGQTFVAVTNGWQATAAAVQVQASVVGEGTQAVIVASGTALSNTVEAAGILRLWSDQRVNPPLGAAPEGVPDAAESVRL